ncbi:MAG TPA: hypothetical protein VI603_08815 [Saprospiraceae bacterium]|nr:hypothetical protein [Saprospiraceae bacterium]
MKNARDLLKTTIAIPLACACMMCFLLGSCAPRYGCYFSASDVQQAETIEHPEVCIALEVCAESVIDLSCTASR